MVCGLKINKRKVIKMREIELYWGCEPDEYEGIKITLYPTKQENDFETILVNEEDHLYEITCYIEEWYLQNVDGNFNFNEDLENDEEDLEKYESLVWQKIEESGRMKECLCDIINDNQDNYEWVSDLIEKAEQILTNKGFNMEEFYIKASENMENMDKFLDEDDE